MRRLYYIKPKIQNPFISYFVFLTAIELLLFRILLYFVQQFQTTISTDLYIYLHFGSVLLLVLVFSFLNVLIGTRLSHRIAGPLVQVQRVLEYALKGEYDTRIKLRSGDFLHEFGNNINLLLDKLEDAQNVNIQLNNSENKQDKISLEN